MTVNVRRHGAGSCTAEREGRQEKALSVYVPASWHRVSRRLEVFARLGWHSQTSSSLLQLRLQPLRPCHRRLAGEASIHMGRSIPINQTTFLQQRNDGWQRTGLAHGHHLEGLIAAANDVQRGLGVSRAVERSPKGRHPPQALLHPHPEDRNLLDQVVHALPQLPILNGDLSG
jgi:hypothetical protein